MKIRYRLPEFLRPGLVEVLPASGAVGGSCQLGRRRLIRVVVRIKFPKVEGLISRPADSHPQTIQGPWQNQPRTAVLSPWFRVNGGARVFFQASPLVLSRFRPGVIAGPVEVLRDLARQVLDSGSPSPVPDYGVLAFTGESLPPLTETDRDLFWRAFQVPVFEQYRDKRGALVAAECEAHQGLHIVIHDAARKLGASRIVDEPCSCGVKSPRLVAPAPPAVRLVKTATAGA